MSLLCCLLFVLFANGCLAFMPFAPQPVSLQSWKKASEMDRPPKIPLSTAVKNSLKVDEEKKRTSVQKFTSSSGADGIREGLENIGKNSPDLLVKAASEIKGGLNEMSVGLKVGLKYIALGLAIVGLCIGRVDILSPTKATILWLSSKVTVQWLIIKATVQWLIDKIKMVLLLLVVLPIARIICVQLLKSFE